MIRQKRAWGKFPVQAAKWCLESRGLTLSDVDYVAYSWDRSRIKDQILNGYDVHPKKLFPAVEFGDLGGARNIVDVDHHLSHAASAFRFSGFPSAAIVVIDGTGEDRGTTLYHGKPGGEITTLCSWAANFSLGLFYEAATIYAGFSRLEAGKLMGLAPYGKGEILPFIRLTETGYEVDVPDMPSYEHVIQYWIRNFIKHFGPANSRSYKYDLSLFRTKETTEFDERIRNMAASIQFTLDETVLHLTRIAKRLTGEKHLCLAGGVALNCTTNGKVLREKLYDRIFIPGPANDTGGAVGAAAEVWHQETHRPLASLGSLGLGPSFGRGEIAELLKKWGIRYTSVSAIENVAKFIANGKVGAWFSGGAELGPRALGHRSILADPSIKANRDHLNINVKQRETWRPYGPSMLAEYTREAFGEHYDLPYMLFTMPVTGAHDHFQAVLHVDRTTRPQTVTPESNAPYAYLLENLKSELGFPAVLNTSFNFAGEPIVCRPEEAVKAFFASPLDFLYMEGLLIWKEN